MADLVLTFALTHRWDRVQPLITGEVKPRDITLQYVQVATGKLWEAQLLEQAYDVSEMSFSFTLQAIPLGWDYRVLPVFHNRTFSYVNTLVRLDSGIRPGYPGDLKGKRVGVVDYTMTAALWARGILHHEFGIAPQDVEWFQGRAFPSIPGQSEPLAPIEGLMVQPPPNDINAMLAAGQLDAIFSVFPVTESTLSDRRRASGAFRCSGYAPIPAPECGGRLGSVLPRPRFHAATPPTCKIRTIVLEYRQDAQVSP